MSPVSAPVPPLPKLHSGKVRDIYEAGPDRLLMVTSDRLSAFDVVLAEPIPDKGRVLTAISAFWFDRLAPIVPGHLLGTDLGLLEADTSGWDPDLAGRVMVCRRAEMLPIEAIVRGHLTGSGWSEYRRSGTVHGMDVPVGLVEAAALPEPMFTPSTKADVGDHDVNISFREAADRIGTELAERVRDVSLRLFTEAAAHAASRGIIVADTKFEFGLVDGELMLCDEVLTPDSSRFWPADSWEPGRTPPSFDKQPVRDLLDELGWDRTPPPPPIGPETVSATRARYVEAYERLTGRSFSDWPGVRGAGVER